MRALLRPVIVRELGVVMLKPGRELLGLFTAGRVLVQSQPASMANHATGFVPDAQQPLSRDAAIRSFFLHHDVIRAAGGISALDYWLLNYSGGACQNSHSDYHYHEFTVLHHEPGSILLCGHCDNQLREQHTEALAELARRNVINWVLDNIRHALMLDKSRELSLSELCWWAVINGVTSAIPDSVARKALNLPDERVVKRESDIQPIIPATSIVAEKVAHVDLSGMLSKPITKLTVDPESPQTLMKRPKHLRWEDLKFIRWVKVQPCACCGQPSDDAHHLIGWGQGGMGTKAHDSLVIPLCRKHHTELHNDPVKFERKYGSQPALIIKLLDRAFALGVLA
ncbi:DUF968 domain-containing protein [Lelliottia amnigena]|uniref:DUF968 domain-containing protein n=1 Tax=Lelliottia amnigena TaxID=61646 RepID=A0AAP2EYY0_LELAM|nr:DUF968 domain-containing protein [Lelliottia amnigena]MBL5898070.1 DUF968 domain-containing protein [Lelliottia amnigena]MBL5934123.1 DUF968 domain-containing protein [Lelliottia amnigena]